MLHDRHRYRHTAPFQQHRCCLMHKPTLNWNQGQFEFVRLTYVFMQNWANIKLKLYLQLEITSATIALSWTMGEEKIATTTFESNGGESNTMFTTLLLEHECDQTIGHFVRHPRNLNHSHSLSSQSWNSQGLRLFSTDRYFISRHQLFWADVADTGSLSRATSFQTLFYCENLEQRQTF